VNDKLTQLARLEGFTNTDDLLQEAMTDSVVKGICCNSGCDYTTDVEPDCATGWCEECSKNTVKSALVLAGII